MNRCIQHTPFDIQVKDFWIDARTIKEANSYDMVWKCCCGDPVCLNRTIVVMQVVTDTVSYSLQFETKDERYECLNRIIEGCYRLANKVLRVSHFSDEHIRN